MATSKELVKKSEEELARMIYEQTMLLKAEIEDEGHPEPDGDEGGEVPPEGSEDVSEGSEGAPAPEDTEGGDGDSMPTVEELVAEFQQMSPEHLELFKQAIARVQGGSEASPEAAPAPTPEMGKSELSLKLQAAKELRLAAEALNKREVIASAKPIRTTPRVAPKAPPKSLSKSEVHDRLLSLSKSASTKDSDRQAINQYYSKGDLSAVKHLLG